MVVVQPLLHETPLRQISQGQQLGPNKKKVGQKLVEKQGLVKKRQALQMGVAPPAGSGGGTGSSVFPVRQCRLQPTIVKKKNVRHRLAGARLFPRASWLIRAGSWGSRRETKTNGEARVVQRRSATCSSTLVAGNEASRCKERREGCRLPGWRKSTAGCQMSSRTRT